MAKILLIEDDVVLRPLLKQVLGYLGHDVGDAENGEEGILKLRAEYFDLVLTDLIMPDKEGLETIQEIKKGWPKLKIIAMSGGGRGSGLDYLVLARQLGADQVLSKPFSNQELSRIIDIVLTPEK